MARSEFEHEAPRHLWILVGIGAGVAMLHRSYDFHMGDAWPAFALALGGWALFLRATYRKTLEDRPRQLEGDPRRQAIPALIGGVFWYFGWFFGLVAVVLWRYYEKKRPKEAGESDPSALVDRRQQALQPEGLEAETIELQTDDPPRPMPAAEPAPPAMAEANVPAAPEPPPPEPTTAFPLEPLADPFGRPAAEPLASSSAPRFSVVSEGFDEVLAKLQGKPSDGDRM